MAVPSAQRPRQHRRPDAVVVCDKRAHCYHASAPNGPMPVSREAGSRICMSAMVHELAPASASGPTAAGEGLHRVWRVL
jgi:hypothetical protein